MSEDSINKKQKLLIEYLISRKEVFARVFRILEPSYFAPPLDRVVEVVMKYFMEYSNAPSVEVVEAETGILLTKRDVEDHEIAYLLEEIEEHCQTEAMAAAILESADRVSSGDRTSIGSLVRDAMLVRLDSDIGLDFFHDPAERIRMMNEHVVNYSCGIREMDEMVGYLHRGELGMTFAVSSGGKSLKLANMALALSKQKLDVLIVSLEMNEHLSAKRMDAMLSGVDISTHQESADEIAEKLAEAEKSMGKIFVKQMVAYRTTPAILRSYLMEYNIIHGKFPDVFIVDYLKLLGVDNSKRASISEQDDEKSIELRAMAVEFDMIVLSAGQVNRDGQDVLDINASHVAGGIVVVNNSDWSIAIVASEEDIDNNTVQYKALKQRNAAKTTNMLTVYRCPKTLVFSTTPFTSVAAKTSPIYNKIKSVQKKKDEKPAIEALQAKTGRDRLRSALKIK